MQFGWCLSYSCQRYLGEGGNCYSRNCPLEQQMMEPENRTELQAQLHRLPPGTVFFEMRSKHTLRISMCSHLSFSTIVLAGCWPKNVLGEPKLAYCLSARHLLGGTFLLQLQPRYLYMPESASVSSLAYT